LDPSGCRTKREPFGSPWLFLKIKGQPLTID
jgi:hypothetical protein